MILRGNGFTDATAASVNGKARPVNVSGDTQLSLALTSDDVSNWAALAITLSNPAPGGGPSNAIIFQVSRRSPIPPPTISSIGPMMVSAGSPARTFAISGSGIAVNAVARLRAAKTQALVARDQAVVVDPLVARQRDPAPVGFIGHRCPFGLGKR